MILGIEKSRPRQIGGRYTGVWIDDVCYPDQPFVVLREATYEEWIADQVPPGAEPKPRCDPAEALFYEVSLN